MGLGDVTAARRDAEAQRALRDAPGELAAIFTPEQRQLMALSGDDAARFAVRVSSQTKKDHLTTSARCGIIALAEVPFCAAHASPTRPDTWQYPREVVALSS